MAPLYFQSNSRSRTRAQRSSAATREMAYSSSAHRFLVDMSAIFYHSIFCHVWPHRLLTRGLPKSRKQQRMVHPRWFRSTPSRSSTPESSLQAYHSKYHVPHRLLQKSYVPSLCCQPGPFSFQATLPILLDHLTTKYRQACKLPIY